MAYSVQFSNFVHLQWASTRSRATLKQKEQAVWSPFNLGFIAIQAILFGTLLYYFIERQTLSNLRLGWLSIFVGGYLILFIIKAFIDTAVGKILKKGELINPYLYFKISFFSGLSLLLSILLAIIAYTSVHPTILRSSLLIFLCVAAAVFLILVWNKYKDIAYNAPYYFILYFCALEIAPYYILYKLIANS